MLLLRNIYKDICAKKYATHIFIPKYCNNCKSNENNLDIFRRKALMETRGVQWDSWGFLGLPYYIEEVSHSAEAVLYCLPFIAVSAVCFKFEATVLFSVSSQQGFGFHPSKGDSVEIVGKWNKHKISFSLFLIFLSHSQEDSRVNTANMRVCIGLSHCADYSPDWGLSNYCQILSWKASGQITEW